MNEDSSSAPPTAQHDWFIQSLVNVANVAPLSFGVTLQVSGLLVSVPQFVHLQNARFYSTDGKPVPTHAGVWWRGRISEISGIVIGILGVGE
jgi:hypothetical protein